MYWGFIFVYINNVMILGYDNVMMLFFVCIFVSLVVVLVIFFKIKDKKLKEMVILNFIFGIFGVIELVIYGILLFLKKLFIISCIVSGIGGVFYGFFNFRKFIIGGMGIFEFLVMIELDGGMGNLIVVFFGIVILMVVVFVLIMILYKDEKVEEFKKVRNKGKEEIKEVKFIKLEREIVISFIKGEVLKLSDIEDVVFVFGVLG